MGFDKASMTVDGEPCAARLARLLRDVSSMAVEVGPGVSGLPAVHEDPPGSGPLVALAAGAAALRARGHGYSALVLACDLPLVTGDVLRALAGWAGDGSVVPVVGGRAQPLCARWSAEDLVVSAELAATGHRSLRPLLERPDVTLVEEDDWPAAVDRRVFADADTPEDLERLGLHWRPPAESRRHGSGR